MKRVAGKGSRERERWRKLDSAERNSCPPKSAEPGWPSRPRFWIALSLGERRVRAIDPSAPIRLFFFSLVG